ncbi:hypothetical protein K3495_g12070 [Podosphaera aphanis]|nr:hypothetical protein K3495_g12070 [Podosphaera aphanis]
MSDNEVSSEQSEPGSDVLPNRFKGISQRWQHFTEQERGEYASVIEARNRDLSIHLYNAHALRQRAKEFHEDPSNAKVNKEYSVIPENHRTFKPPRRWTAWPLPPHEVPRLDETSALTGDFETQTLKKGQIKRPRTEIEDELFGIALNFARKKFEARTSESDRKKILRIDDAEKVDYQECESTNVVGDKVPKSSPALSLKPILSLDDEKSQQLLRPSLRHSLTELDKVLMALHQCRKTCHRYSEPYSDNESTPVNIPEKRSKGRPRKLAPVLDNVAADIQLEHQDQLQADPSSPKKTRRGRPPKIYERLDGESQQEFAVRIARMKKKSIPDFTPRAKSSPRQISPKTKSTPSGRKSEISKNLQATRSENLGLRDWSEVLGSAAIAQIPGNVIARATQRCANLFEEGMVMRSIVETSFTDNHADFTTRYEPLQVSSLPFSDSDSYEELVSSASDTDVEITISEGFNGEVSRASTDREPATLDSITSLPKTTRKRKAREDSDDVEPANLLPSDEEVSGAVHVDGFLKKIKTKGDVRKRRKIERESQAGKTTNTEAKLTLGSSSSESNWTSDSD